MKVIARWLRRPPDERRLLVKAAGLNLVIRAGLAVLPFQLLYRLVLAWGQRGHPRRAANIEAIAWVVERSGRAVLGEKRCLAQALAMLLLLHRQGTPAELRIGVRHAQGVAGNKEALASLEAHAWVVSEGKVVMGGTQQVVDEFRELKGSRCNDFVRPATRFFRSG